MAQGFDAPPTLERSGSEHRRCGYILSSLREERLGEKGGAFFNGKEGRDDFRKTFFNGKEGRVGFRKNYLNIFRNQNPFSIRKDFQSPSAPHVSYPSPKD